MEMSVFNPWNVGERNYDVTRLKQKLPFYSAYLVTDENSQNVSFNVETTVPASIAEFLFQKTVCLAINENNSHQGNGHTQDIAEFFDRAERGENPKYTEYDQPLSYNFMTYGIKRLAIPEVEILEYFGYNFAEQAVNQMLYNNLTKEKGFVGEPKAISEDDYSLVIDKKHRDKWLLSRQYLCLSLPILPEHKKERWQTINDDFSIQIGKIRHKVMDDKNIKHTDKFIAIHNLTRRFFDHEFRPIREEGQNGVVNFFADKSKYGKNAMAEYIVDRIGQDFFNSWINGEYSLQQLSAMTERLIQTMEEERTNLKVAISSANDNINHANKTIYNLEKDWNGLGAIGKLGVGNTKSKIEHGFVQAIIDKYSFMAWTEAYGFAIELCDAIINLLTIQKSNIDKVNSEIKKVAEDIAGAIKSRCSNETEEEQSLKGMVIKYFDSVSVQQICKVAIQLDSNLTRVRDVRAKISERLASDKQNFKEAAEKLNRGNVKQQLEQIVMEQASSLFADANQTKNIPQLDQLIGVNIIDKLKTEFSGNEEALKEKLKRLVSHAAVMAKENPTEIHDGPQIRRSMFIVLPSYDKDQVFLDKLKNIIQGLAPSTEEIPKVSEGGNENEIIVMNLEANITPRYLMAVKYLHEDYDKLMTSAGKADIALFETRIEDYENPLPSLFKPTDAEIKAQHEAEIEKALPNILLAKAMNILTMVEDPETGLEKLAYIPEDEDGLLDLSNMIVLGRSIEKSMDKIDSRMAKILEVAVRTKLIKEYRHIDKQTEVKASVLTEIKSIISKNGALSEISKKFNQAFKCIKETFERINDM